MPPVGAMQAVTVSPLAALPGADLLNRRMHYTAQASRWGQEG